MNPLPSSGPRAPTTEASVTPATVASTEASTTPTTAPPPPTTEASGRTPPPPYSGSRVPGPPGPRASVFRPPGPRAPGPPGPRARGGAVRVNPRPNKESRPRRVPDQDCARPPTPTGPTVSEPTAVGQAAVAPPALPHPEPPTLLTSATPDITVETGDESSADSDTRIASLLEAVHLRSGNNAAAGRAAVSEHAVAVPPTPPRTPVYGQLSEEGLINYSTATRALLGRYLGTTWPLLGHNLGTTWALLGQLETVRNCSLLLETARNCSKLLETAGNC